MKIMMRNKCVGKSIALKDAYSYIHGMDEQTRNDRLKAGLLL